jgi:hypothetical protein
LPTLLFIYSHRIFGILQCNRAQVFRSAKRIDCDLKGSVAALPFIFLQLLPGKISENRVGFNFNITTLRLKF